MDVYISYTPGRMEAVSVLGEGKSINPIQLKALLNIEQCAGLYQTAASVSIIRDIHGPHLVHNQSDYNAISGDTPVERGRK